MKSSAGNPAVLKDYAAPIRDNSPKRKSRNGSASYGLPKAAKKPREKRLRNGLSQINIAPAKIILWSLIAGICGFIYINHVFTTQQLLQKTSEVQREYERVRMIHEDRSLTHDRLTGPAEVFYRARALGYQDSGPADHIIIMGY